MANDWGALIQQVKQANDIVEVVGGYVNLRPSGPTFKGLCPFHDDHRPSFDVDPRRQRYRCWSCQKHGDVITFVQEYDRVDFLEALELLAKRAGIALEKSSQSPQNRSRALMLDVVRWASEEYQRCLLDSSGGEAARRYLGERKIQGETTRRFGLGFAPAAGDWLIGRAERAGISFELLEQVGLIAPRQEGRGYYDRFRERVMFPIRDTRGQTVGFGGRILPHSASAERVAKYYNSCDSPLFTKREHLYGLDLARQVAGTSGYLAVVEGYTDVLMAHQEGIAQVVATMGTALGPRHVQQLRRFVPRVVLVFDADAGGNTGVDRAVQIFVSQDVDLAIATLPEGRDPCDLLLEQGAQAFRAALESAVDALDFKLNQVLSSADSSGIEGRRRAIDTVLDVMAGAEEMPSQAGAIKQELAINRIAQRLGVRETILWARLKELRQRVQVRTERNEPQAQASPVVPAAAPAAAIEKELMQVLLADADLVAIAAAQIKSEMVQHPGLRKLLQGMYDLLAAGQTPSLDLLRARIDNPRLVEAALELQDVGLLATDRRAWLGRIVMEFRRKYEELPVERAIKTELRTASDHTTALDLLRRLQNSNERRVAGAPIDGGGGT